MGTPFMLTIKRLFPSTAFQYHGVSFIGVYFDFQGVVPMEEIVQHCADWRNFELVSWSLTCSTGQSCQRTVRSWLLVESIG